MQSSEGSATHSEQSTHGPIIDLNTAPQPSEVTAANRIEEVPQQASTSPGDGSEVRTRSETGGPNRNVVEVPVEKTSFKDQVLGYAKVTRGTALGNAETKEYGKRILEGDPSVQKHPLEKK